MNPQTRREFLAGTASLIGAAPRLDAQKTRRPNVLVIITDDQGYGDLSIHGNRHLKTPHMDRIGQEGVRFSQFHVSPVCAPTRSSLLTGRYNYRTGVVDTYLGRALMYPDEVTLAEMLGKAGYKTGIFGKWHLGDNYPLRAIDQGFQEALIHKGGGLAQPSDAPGSPGYFDPVLWSKGKEEKVKGYCTDIFTDAAMEFMEANKQKPFFAYVATNAPHDPLQVEDRYVRPFLEAKLPERVAKLYGMMVNLDENVGRLLGKVESLGLERDTLVVYLSDNGPAGLRFNAGMRGTKGTVYEGGIRVPCFLRWPGAVKAGGRVDRLAAHIDLTPTILDACGVAAPSTVKFDGKSLMPLVRGEAAGWADRTLFFQWHRGDEPQAFRACAARNQRWKLVDGKELYDLEADPDEKSDVAEANPGVVAELRAAYEAWFKDVSATRGYAPPRMKLGTKHENPTMLTRQDWRGPRAGWKDGDLGHWEVEIARPGRYEFTLTFPPMEGAGEAEVVVGDSPVAERVAVAAKATTVKIGPVKLGAGRADIEPRLYVGGGS